MRRRIHRGQQEPFGGRETPSQPPTYDPSSQADISLAQKKYVTKPGTVPVDANVITTFDARPINGRDFSQLIYLSSSNINTNASISYTVPDGYIGILRWFSYELSISQSLGSDYMDVYGNFNGIGAGPPPNGAITSVTITSGGSPSPDFSGVPFGTSVDRQPCYILCEAGAQIVLTFRLLSNPSNWDSIHGGWMQLYGNLILDTGRPLEFEPGTSEPYPVYLKKR